MDKLQELRSYTGNWDGTDLINAWIEWEKRHKGSKIINLPIIVN